MRNCNSSEQQLDNCQNYDRRTHKTIPKKHGRSLGRSTVDNKFHSMISDIRRLEIVTSLTFRSLKITGDTIELCKTGTLFEPVCPTRRMKFRLCFCARRWRTPKQAGRHSIRVNFRFNPGLRWQDQLPSTTLAGSLCIRRRASWKTMPVAHRVCVRRSTRGRLWHLRPLARRSRTSG